MTRRSPSATSASDARTVRASGARKDEQGRVVNLPQLLGVALGYWAINAIGLLAIDGLLSLAGGSSFGDSSGWLTLILPALLLFEDFRAWRAHRRRYLAVVVAAAVAVALGLLTAGAAHSWVPLAAGGVGALVALVVYILVWFVGVRYVTGDLASEPTSGDRTEGRRKERRR
jgi:hypothetical protein